jgi:DNA gyrase subunit A
VAEDETLGVLTATENGYGKRTPIAEHTRHGRGTQGMIAIQTSDRNGKVVAATLVSPDDEIMLITSGGVLIRTRVNEIREMSRSTQGVTLINLDDGEKLSGLQCILDSDEVNGENGAGNGNGNGNGHAPEAAGDATDTPGEAPANGSGDDGPSIH